MSKVRERFIRAVAFTALIVIGLFDVFHSVPRYYVRVAPAVYTASPDTFVYASAAIATVDHHVASTYPAGTYMRYIQNGITQYNLVESATQLMGITYIAFVYPTLINAEISNVYYLTVNTSLGNWTPMDVASVEFTEGVYIPGTNQNIDAFSIRLLDAAHDVTARRWIPTYNLLNYRQRVEIYENPEFLGNPVFAGILMELPGDLETQEVRGVGVWQYLEDRKLRRVHQLTGNARDEMQMLLKTYEVVFKDNFNRTTGIGANWTVSGTEWTITSNYLVKNSLNRIITTVATYSDSQWENSKFSFDFYFPDGGNSTDYLYAYLGDGTYTFGFEIKPFPSSFYRAAGMIFYDIQTETSFRYYILPTDTWNHADIYFVTDAGITTGIFVINGIEIMQYVFSNTLTNPAWKFSSQRSSATTSVRIDNFIFASAQNAIANGTLATTTEAPDWEFNGDTQLAVLNRYADYLDWEYRINYGAGKGNDTFDAATSVGADYSSVIILEEGKNIENLQRRRTSQDLATSLLVYGQSQDDGTSNIIVNELDQMDTYGVIERDFSDSRITAPGIAKIIGDNQLAIVSAGNVSLSGRVVDESKLFEQSPIWGYAVWGDFAWGGRQKLRAGDTVWLKSTTLNIDRAVKIVSVTRRSGDQAIDLVFDWHGWRRSDQQKMMLNQIAQTLRSVNLGLDTQAFPFILSGTTAQTIAFYMRGNYAEVYLDLLSASWGGQTVTVTIDGVNRTTALFGAATVGANAHATDTVYLVLSGAHEITLTPSGSINVTTGIVPRLMRS